MCETKEHFIVVIGHSILEIEQKMNDLLSDSAITIKQLGSMTNSNSHWYLTLLINKEVPKVEPKEPPKKKIRGGLGRSTSRGKSNASV